MITTETALTIGSVLTAGTFYIMYRYFESSIKALNIVMIERIQKLHKDLHGRIDFVNNKCKDKKQADDICSSSELNNIKHRLRVLEDTKKEILIYDNEFFDRYRFDERIRRCEVKLFSHDDLSEGGGRVISVEVLPPKDVPCVSEPLNNSGVAPRPVENFNPKTKKENECSKD